MPNTTVLKLVKDTAMPGPISGDVTQIFNALLDKPERKGNMMLPGGCLTLISFKV